MLSRGKIVLNEGVSIILLSSCRPGPWITLRTTFLIRFPYPSINTGTVTHWRFMSRGWHPARKTKWGQRHEKALKMSYKAWGPRSTNRSPDFSFHLWAVHVLLGVCRRSFLTFGGNPVCGIFWGGSKQNHKGNFFPGKNHLLLHSALLYYTMIPVWFSSCGTAALLLSRENK